MVQPPFAGLLNSPGKHDYFPPPLALLRLRNRLRVRRVRLLAAVTTLRGRLPCERLLRDPSALVAVEVVVLGDLAESVPPSWPCDERVVRIDGLGRVRPSVIVLTLRGRG